MRTQLSVLLLILFSFFFQSPASAATEAESCPICTVSMSHENHSDPHYICGEGDYCIHSGCLANFLKDMPDTQLMDLAEYGVEVCSKNADPAQGKKRVTLSTVLNLLEPKDRAVLGQRIAKAWHFPLEEEHFKQIQRLSEDIERSLNLCCPNNGCGAPLDRVEGCNDATCDSCHGRFCYMCFKKLNNSKDASTHIKEHTGDSSNPTYDLRPGSIPRYHWLKFREEFAHVFKYKINRRIRSEALALHENLLREKNLWPMPAGTKTKYWIQEVSEAPELPKITPEIEKKFNQMSELAKLVTLNPERKGELSRKKSNKSITPEELEEFNHMILLEELTELKKGLELSPERKIQLLQNEYIFLRQQGDRENAAIVKKELRRLGAKVLASLDARDSAGEVGDSVPSPGSSHSESSSHSAENPSHSNESSSHLEHLVPYPVGKEEFVLIPVKRGTPGIPPEFAALGEMHRVGNVLWSGIVLQKNGAPNWLKQPDAAKFCEKLGASLATHPEADALTRAMGKGRDKYPPNYGYDRHQIPKMAHNINAVYIWTKTQKTDMKPAPGQPRTGYFYVINGNIGDTEGGRHQDRDEAFMCVLPIR